MFKKTFKFIFIFIFAFLIFNKQAIGLTTQSTSKKGDLYKNSIYYNKSGEAIGHINADGTEFDSIETIGSQYMQIKKDSNGNYLFCSDIDKKYAGGVDCTIISKYGTVSKNNCDGTLSSCDYERWGIKMAKIIKNFLSSPNNQNYLDAQFKIWYILDQTNNSKLYREHYGDMNNYVDNIVSNIDSLISSINNSNNYTYNGSSYSATFSPGEGVYGFITLTGNGNTTVTESAGIYTITSSSNEISVKIDIPIAVNYECGNNQPVISTILSSITRYAGTSLTPPEGKLKIYKVKRDGITKIEGKEVKFQIYTDSNCTNVYGNEIVFSNGISDDITLPSGSYYLKEISAPDGYHLDASCKLFYINSGTTTTETITNKTECEYDFEKDSSIANRISLYENKYSKFNNLLNFNVTDSTSACSHVDCNVSSTSSCLSGSIKNNSLINSNDLSCYTSTVLTYTGVNAYCQDDIEFYTNIDTTVSFKSKKGMSYFFNVFTENSQKDVTRSTYNKVCYSTENSKIDIDDIISEVKLEETKLNSTDISYEGDFVSGTYISNGIYEYSYTKTHIYTLPDICINYIKGEIGTIENGVCKIGNITTNLYKKIENSLMSKYISSSKGEFIFNVKLEQAIYNVKELSGTCNYELEEELIKYSPTCDNPPCTLPTTSGELNLIYRKIDATDINDTDTFSNAFPGINGVGRTTGKNWCSSDDCNSNNDLVKDIINNRNNSYNKKSSDPLYTIELTSSDIKTIRAYNKNNSYDDYNYDSDGKNIFIKNLLTEGTIDGNYISNKLIYNEPQWLIDFNK